MESEEVKLPEVVENREIVDPVLVPEAIEEAEIADPLYPPQDPPSEAIIISQDLPDSPPAAPIPASSSESPSTHMQDLAVEFSERHQTTLEAPEAKFDEQNPISESKSVFVSLKSFMSPHAKQPSVNLEIAERLKIRENQVETKISNNRLRQKAKQIVNSNFIPTINPKSKQILEKKMEAKVKTCETLNSEDDDTLYNYIPDSPKSSPKLVSAIKNRKEVRKQTGGEKTTINNEGKIGRRVEISDQTTMQRKKAKKKNEFDGTTAELLKCSMKIREHLKDAPVPEPDINKLTFQERSKLVLIKKEEKFEEHKRMKQKSELDQCTFKPTLVSQTPQAVTVAPAMKHSKSETLSKKSQQSEQSLAKVQPLLHNFSYRVPPPGSTVHQNAKAKKRVLDNNPIVTEKYSQISPYTQPVKYKIGFNVEEILAKGQPMVSYNLEDD